MQIGTIDILILMDFSNYCHNNVGNIYHSFIGIKIKIKSININ
jgi:hypothetical protein